jgi:hypothetical protein
MTDSTVSHAGTPSDWLVFECSACARPLKVRPHQSGSRMRCPACSADIVAPSAPRSGETKTVPLISEANPELAHLATVGELSQHLAVDRLNASTFRTVKDPALAIPAGGLRVRKRKRRTNQTQQKTGTPEWEVGPKEPDKPAEETNPWRELTSATVGIDHRGDGSVIERRKRFLKKRLPRILERLSVMLASLGIWSLMGLGALVLLGAIVAGWYVARSHTAPLAPVVVVEQFPQPLYASMDEGSAAAEVVKNFLLADGVDAKLAYVRFPEKVLPLMRSWYASHFAGPVESTRDDVAISLTKWIYVEDMKFIVVTMQLLPSLEYKFFPVQSSPLGLKLDWETSVGWQAMTVDEFRKGRPTSPQPFRVHVGPGDYYNGPYQDETQWLCCDLTYPGDDSFHLFGYVERASEAGAVLAKHFSQDESISAILAIHYRREGSDPNQVTIHSIISKEWFLRAGPAMPTMIQK